MKIKTTRLFLTNYIKPIKKLNIEYMVTGSIATIFLDVISFT